LQPTLRLSRRLRTKGTKEDRRHKGKRRARRVAAEADVGQTTGRVSEQNSLERGVSTALGTAKRAVFALAEWDAAHPRWNEFVRCLESVAPEQSPFVLGDYARHLPCHLCVALQGDQVVGFLRFGVQIIGLEAHCPPLQKSGIPLTEAKIHAFAVREDQRGQGIGKALQRWAIERAKGLGCYQLASYSSYGRDANHHVKLSLGFCAQPENSGDQLPGVYFLMRFRLGLGRSDAGNGENLHATPPNKACSRLCACHGACGRDRENPEKIKASAAPGASRLKGALERSGTRKHLRYPSILFAINLAISSPLLAQSTMANYNRSIFDDDTSFWVNAGLGLGHPGVACSINMNFQSNQWQVYQLSLVHNEEFELFNENSSSDSATSIGALIGGRASGYASSIAGFVGIGSVSGHVRGGDDRWDEPFSTMGVLGNLQLFWKPRITLGLGVELNTCVNPKLSFASAQLSFQFGSDR